MNLLFTPHADDETLFAAFQIIAHAPNVVICFPSGGDYGPTAVRTEESREAVAFLGGGTVTQWDGTFLEEQMRALDEAVRPVHVFAPSPRSSHVDHVSTALAAARVFRDRVTRFHTYDAAGKVRAGDPVPFSADWLPRKRRALACYRSQIMHPRARAFFSWDLTEYVDP